jgi:hypothetical protein
MQKREHALWQRQHGDDLIDAQRERERTGKRHDGTEHDPAAEHFVPRIEQPAKIEAEQDREPV